MKQKTILWLLSEAAELAKDKRANFQRLNQIQCELTHAVYDDDEGDDPLNSRAAGLQTLCDSLYVETLYNAPDKLPQLFPVFAMLCGDRDSMIIAHPDWAIVSNAG